MDERRYLELAEAALSRIVAAFDEVELDDADVDSVGDVVNITVEPGARGAGGKIVINTQRPARQIWLAGGNRAWHFSYEEATGRWLDDKGSGAELFDTVRELCGRAGLSVALASPAPAPGAGA
jgi:CyaY protein